MTEVTPRARPAWDAQLGARVTSLSATPGTTRTDANGTQWWLDDGHQWRPVVPAPPGRAQPRAELEAGS